VSGGSEMEVSVGFDLSISGEVACRCVVRDPEFPWSIATRTSYSTATSLRVTESQIQSALSAVSCQLAPVGVHFKCQFYCFLSFS
jgi:hypothetical protein